MGEPWLRTTDSRYDPGPGIAAGAGHELLLRAPQRQHTLALSLFRPHSVEWADSTIPAAGESRRLLQYVSAAITGDTVQPDQFQHWVKERAAKRNIPIVEAPKGRRDDFVDPYFEQAKPDAVVVILKGREPARIMIAIGDKIANRWHLQIANRWVVQYNFYINDRHWGRMFVRMCPYFPFSARICLNQHHWLANRLRESGVRFKQLANDFLTCAAPDRLQALANSLIPRDLVTCGPKWLAHLTPFFTAREREEAGCRHRLFFSQVEFCDNLVFRRRSALDKLGERLLDANRTIG